MKKGIKKKIVFWMDRIGLSVMIASFFMFILTFKEAYLSDGMRTVVNINQYGEAHLSLVVLIIGFICMPVTISKLEKNVDNQTNNRMIHIRLPEDLHKRVRIRAAETDQTIQDWVVEALQAELNRQEKEKKAV